MPQFLVANYLPDDFDSSTGHAAGEVRELLFYPAPEQEPGGSR